MIEQLFPGLYRIGVPLVGPLRELNAYVVLGTPRHLLIDGGFNMPQARGALLDGLREMDVDILDCDFFVTHYHADHSGLISHLPKGPSAKVYASAVDAAIVNRIAEGEPYWQGRIPDFLESGFGPDEVDLLVHNHPAYLYGPRAMRFEYVEEGYVLTYGAYSLKVMSMPGHTSGLLCLYDEARRILFSSDHILGNITPSILRPRDGRNQLGDFLASLDKADRIPMDLALPGHRQTIGDPHRRIRELKRHHEERMQEVMDVLDAPDMKLLEVASRMKWSVRGLPWDQVPIQQKFFACNEAYAHMVHMSTFGWITIRRDGDGVLRFSKR